MLWLLTIDVAFGRSVAVLPLEPGTGSERFEGLGIAIADMLITDLSHVPEVELVERGQINAVLDEIELSSKGYLDPRTVSRLGKGVGADWVVVGSWSVIETQFLLSVRAVEVSSGTVLGSASTQGTTNDFVSVEKDLIEQLLQALEVPLTGASRRRILSAAPTESFDAVSSYGAGLVAEKKQDYEAAKRRFKEAARADPSFDLPGRRLAALQAQIKQLGEERRTERADGRKRELEAGLARTPDELSLSKPSSPDEFAQLRIRWAFLNQLKRPCQASEEMRHALDRHAGKLPTTQDSWKRVHLQAFKLGIYQKAPRLFNGTMSPPNEYAANLLQRRVGGSTPYHFIIGIVDGIDRMPEMSGSTLAILTVACAGLDPHARVGALVDLRASVRSLGLEDATPGPSRAVTIGQELEILELDARAHLEGMSERVAKRLDALLAIDAANGTSHLSGDVRKVTSHAARADLHRQIKGALSYEQARFWIEAAHRDGAPIQFDSPACAPMKTSKWRLDRYDEALEDGIVTTKEYSYVADVLLGAHTLRLLGCVQGEAGLLDTTAKAAAWLQSFPERRHASASEKCDAWYAEMMESTTSIRRPTPNTPERGANRIVVAGLHKMVSRGCARP